MAAQPPAREVSSRRGPGQHLGLELPARRQLLVHAAQPVEVVGGEVGSTSLVFSCRTQVCLRVSQKLHGPTRAEDPLGGATDDVGEYANWNWPIISAPVMSPAQRISTPSKSCSSPPRRVELIHHPEAAVVDRDHVDLELLGESLGVDRLVGVEDRPGASPSRRGPVAWAGPNERSHPAERDAANVIDGDLLERVHTCLQLHDLSSSQLCTGQRAGRGATDSRVLTRWAGPYVWRASNTRKNSGMSRNRTRDVAAA